MIWARGGSAQIGVEIQHKDPFLADQGAIGAVPAVENDVVPFDRLLTCCSRRPPLFLFLGVRCLSAAAAAEQGR